MAATPLRSVLMDFTRIEGVQGVAIVSKDGFIVDSVISGGFDPEALAAMVTTLAGTATRISEELRFGDLDILIGEYRNNYLLLEDLGEAYLVVIADKRAILGRVRYEVRKQRDRVRAAL